MKEWWAHRTLRFRLALWYAVGGIVLLAGFSATLYIYVAERMGQPLAHLLHQDLALVRRNLTILPEGTVLWKGEPMGYRPPWGGSEYPWFELWDEYGNMERRFWPYSESKLDYRSAAPTRRRETLSVFSVAPDLRLRVLSVPHPVPGREGDWMIRMMRRHEPTGDALGALRWIIVLALPIVIALLVAVGYFLTRRWLIPLDRMAAEAERISADRLSARLPVANPHDELGRMAGVFNETLDRLEASFTALDRFVADASHELRTPLTALRTVGEVALRKSRTVDEYREVIGSMLEEAQRLQLLIQRLLELASAEGGEPEVHRTLIDLADCVSACVTELGILAESKGQRIAVDPMPCRVATDGVIFRQALQNLIDNAIKYSPPDATIHVGMKRFEHHIEVTVTDDGPGLDAEARRHLSERFFRPDRGRGRNDGGFGLGLSITKAYMRVLGGSLEWEAAHPRGSRFRLLLPTT